MRSMIFGARRGPKVRALAHVAQLSEGRGGAEPWRSALASARLPQALLPARIEDSLIHTGAKMRRRCYALSCLARQVLVGLRRPWPTTGGVSVLSFEPAAFLRRLAPLIPPPWLARATGIAFSTDPAIPADEFDKLVSKAESENTGLVGDGASPRADRRLRSA